MTRVCNEYAAKVCSLRLNPRSGAIESIGPRRWIQDLKGEEFREVVGEMMR